MFLDSIGGNGNDSASRKIRFKTKKGGNNVECMGHRDASTSVAIQRWDHTVWTCDRTYSGKTWDGLKEDCHILKRNRLTTKVCGI